MIKAKHISYHGVFLSLLCLTLFISCGPTKFDKEKYGNCSDGLRNQNEEGVDCGGHCLPCSSCNDGEKNQGEAGIDCGGQCISCQPACTIPSSSVEYTLHPNSSSQDFKDNSDFTYAYFNKNSSDLGFDFTGSIMREVNIVFLSGFNPFDNIALNETMVFTTIEDDNFVTVSKKSQIKASYRAYVGINYYNGSFLKDQAIHFSRISDTQILVRFCDLVGDRDNDRLSMNAIFK